jgi:hypothetical protein
VFRYACFISYRHGHQPGTQRFYEAFRRELAIQVDFYLPGMDVYLDTNRVRGGDFFNRELASALCSSVCMVMLFNPLYFDASNSYAAREYRAMVALEQQRLALLPAAGSRGLIIPIVIRGSLPDAIKGERHFYSMDYVAAEDLRTQRARKALKLVADDIYQRHKAFRSALGDPFAMCKDFEFPSEGDIMEWLDGVTAPSAKIPWR